MTYYTSNTLNVCVLVVPAPQKFSAFDNKLPPSTANVHILSRSTEDVSANGKT